ncbi:alpha/beta hydrolase [Kribbella sp. NPDC056861]|uniref:alpha/beta fold hydrolase n=1 Tax=Kribbella sp. NPDC056861 TaxID=3154857 RepID=UPI0034432EE9
MTTPVVLLPGLGLGPESYAPTAQYLSTPYEVVTLPGYGHKVHRDDDLRTEALAERLARHLTEPTVLVGHSATCQVAVATALAHPDLVTALVLVAPSGDRRASSWPTLIGRLLRSAVWESPRLVPVLLKQYLRTGLASMAKAMDVARRYDLAAAAEKLELPTTIIRSSHDRIAPEHWTHQLAERTGGEAWTFPTGSHLPVLTNPGELAAFINRAAGVYNRQ